MNKAILRHHCVLSLIKTQKGMILINGSKQPSRPGVFCGRGSRRDNKGLFFYFGGKRSLTEGRSALQTIDIYLDRSTGRRRRIIKGVRLLCLSRVQQGVFPKEVK